MTIEDKLFEPLTCAKFKSNPVAAFSPTTLILENMIRRRYTPPRSV